MTTTGDSPVCKKCGGKRVPMKTSKGGGWYLGCPACQGKTTKDDDPPKPAPKKDEEKKGGTGGWREWVDSIMD